VRCNLQCYLSCALVFIIKGEDDTMNAIFTMGVDKVHEGLQSYHY
jgi:hypothetical protein